MKKVVEKLQATGKSQEDVDAFKKNAQSAAKKILGKFDDYDLYKGESMEEGSMYVLVNYREDGVTPYATFWKDGLEEYKV